MANLTPEFLELRTRLEAQEKELAELRGSVSQMDKVVSGNIRQSIWQLLALLVTLFIAIFGGLTWQTNQLDKRLEQIERRIDVMERNLNTRIEQSEKNITARFEDFKQEMRATRK